MRRNSLAVLLCIALALSLIGQALAKNRPYAPPPRGPVQTSVANPTVENRVHNAGKMWMNVTNRGYLGNSGPGQDEAMEDPCPPGDWAPQCEFPGGSGQQYLFQAGLWIGALIEDSGFVTPRVSVGTDGWFTPSINEFFPGEGVNDGIIERSTRPGYSNCLGVPVFDSAAVSDQDFICVMTDTLTNDNFWVRNDPVDGMHRPLGIKITQTSYSFSQAFAEDFILIDYEIENIASNFLKNLYVGLYVDSDCGPATQLNHHTDDICGFVRNVEEEAPDGGAPLKIPIDVAWIADNDGRPPTASSGAFDNPHVTGTRVIRGPNPRLATSFNWWISNEDVNLDYGPTWRLHAEDGPLSWTRTLGTPVGDLHKYQVLSNQEFDFWQISVDDLTTTGVPADTIIVNGVPEPREWDTEDPSTQQADIADGFDTRYLISWGPLGVFDHVDGSGNRIYRLNPGEKFKMTLAYVGGEFFHNPSNPQPSNTNIDSSLFNFEDIKNNAKWAKDVYDNRMYDTRQWDWGADGEPDTHDEGEGDGIYDTGDGWYGEDVGSDGLFAVLPPGVDSVRVVYFKGTADSIFAGYYKGPDTDGTERNGRLDPITNNPILLANAHHAITSEDDIMPEDLVYLGGREVPENLGYWDMGFMSGNGIMDYGDGIPDFTGPPPPPIPAMMDCLPGTANSASHFGGVVRNGCYVGGLGYELTKDEVILRWSKRSSENPDYVDPFSRLQDFEGYRIHVSGINLENEYDLLGEWDKIDFAYFSSGDSLMTEPVDQATAETLPQDSTINNVTGYLRPVGKNTGFAGEFDSPNIVLNDSTYEFRIRAHSLAPRYYAITAFDYGDPTSGLLSLTTRATTNAVLLAPAGDPKKPVMVVPNPYRAYQDYTSDYLGQAWENQNDGTAEYYPQVDRRIEFTNLPERCLIRIFTVSGDLVQIIPHNEMGDESSWASLNSEKWNLNSRNTQQVVSGIYLFSVEDMKDHSVETGKFVIIK
jgi:hypothetical protein